MAWLGKDLERSSGSEPPDMDQVTRQGSGRLDNKHCTSPGKLGMDTARLGQGWAGEELGQKPRARGLKPS